MKSIRIGVIGLGLVAGFAARVFGGDLNPAAATNSVASAMYTLEDIYQYVAAGKTGAVLRAFAEPTAGPASTMHTLNDIMTVVTNRAPVARTGWKTSYQANDDGMFQKGVAWPTPRFANNGDGTATDNLTGLMWTTNANIYGPSATWSNAVTNCTACTVGGYTDWRLPNIRELQSLIDYTINNYPIPAGHPFNFGTGGNGRYWTSTAGAYNSSTKAWYVNIYNSVGGSSTDDKTSSYNMWPVRGGR